MYVLPALLAAALAPTASAGCGELNLQAPFQFAQQITVKETKQASSHAPSGASIVGLWKFQLISQGNTNHNPPIPDGALLDFGYAEWHSDGTEIMNSGGHSPASENFCLGVWGQTGYLNFELNHFPISYDVASGNIANYLNLREGVTLSPSGDSYVGSFTLLIYDTKGNQLDKLVGNVAATRLTVDSTLPSAIPTN